MYDATFDNRSYSFRPKRNAHKAIVQAQSFLQQGYIWVVELDLAKFFDKVNHDKLMGSLMKRIEDKRVLKLIRSYLTTGIIEDGLVSQRIEGTPQGSPLIAVRSSLLIIPASVSIASSLRRNHFIRIPTGSLRFND